MKIEEYYLEIKNFFNNNCLDKNQNLSASKINKNKLLKEKINFYLKIFWSNSSSELYYCVNNEIIIEKKCECGNKLNFKNIKEGYRKFCSPKCANLNIEIQNKSKKTNLDKYGTEFSSQNIKIKEKMKETNLERYGVENTFQSETIKKKIKETNIEKYGVEHNIFNVESQKKRKETNLERYGTEFPSQNQEIKDKMKQTNLEKYGVEHFNKNHITNLQNFNTEYINENFKNENGFLERNKILKFYNISNNLITKSKTKLINILPFQINKNKTQTEIYNYFYKTDNEENKSFEKNNNQSLFNVKMNDKQIIIDNGKKLEIDIFDIDNKMAIEYDGLMFHSFGINKYNMFNNLDKESIDKNKHLRKTELCEEQNIQLFHIFENEWFNNRQNTIWKSMINAKLGKHNKIFARKTIVKEIKLLDKYGNITNKNDNKLIRNFLEKNHMQGYVASGINIGLFIMNESINNDTGLIETNEELISLMTFGKPRMSKEYEWELLRYSSKLNTTIVGGGSKLLKFFENNYKPKSLISYANRRWSTGNFYKKTGFEFSHNSLPNYFYFKPNENILLSRNQFQKHKLENYFKEGKLLLFFDKQLTETQNMYNNGYRKIYDSGNIIFFKKYNISE